MKSYKIILFLITGLLILPSHIHGLRIRTIFATAVVGTYGTYLYTQLYPEDKVTLAINKDAADAKQAIERFARKKEVTNAVMYVGDTIEDVGAELNILFKRLSGQSHTAEQAKNELRKKTRSAARFIDEKRENVSRAAETLGLRLTASK
ncbi:MAG TPA: hypothetical protein VGT41_02345 [Candidatus Babeliales bacterium]|nr:hypothetical protein [Candidatus Babeliales bacterium]